MLLWTLPVVLFPGKMPGEAEKGEGGSLKAMAKGIPKIMIRQTSFYLSFTDVGFNFVSV